MRKRASFALLLAACPVVVATAGHAAGLQVAPALVEVPGNSGTVWLTNENTRTLRAQVRIYRWVQENNEDKLVETEDLIASPPFIEVPNDKRQVVRLVRFGAQAAAGAANAPCEQSFRVIVDELPDFTEEETRTGMNYVLRYSVPVFVQNPKCTAAAPKLSWQLVVNGQQVFVEVANTGDMRAQLANVRLIGAGGTVTTLAGGLMGYVLPGATRRFAVDLDPAAGLRAGEIEVQLNGSPARQPIALSVPSI
jgi:fimbrial chaperone protein